MYFDVWSNDILKAIQSLKGKLAPEDCVLANTVLFKIMKSPLWRSEFEGAVLSIHQDNTGYSFIKLPEISDPDNEGLTIREETVFNILDHRYEYPMYCEEGYPLWVYDRDAAPLNLTEVPSIELLPEITEFLSENQYYRKLLTTDPVEIESLKRLCDKIEYSVVVENSISELIQSTGISRYDNSVVTQLFGHRYATRDENRIYVIAQNIMGPVGILSLFDHSQKGVSHSQPDLLSISFVSVTPGYRRQGIASSLMKTAFDYCLRNEKMLGRTDPTEIGKLTAGHFSKLAKAFAPALPFMTRQEMMAMSIMQRRIPNLRDMPYLSKTKVIQQGLERIRLHEGQMFDLSDRQELELKQYCDSFASVLEKGF